MRGFRLPQARKGYRSRARIVQAADSSLPAAVAIAAVERRAKGEAAGRLDNIVAAECRLLNNPRRMGIGRVRYRGNSSGT